MTHVAVHDPPHELMRASPSVLPPLRPREVQTECHLLLLEDDSDISGLLMRALARLGYDVEVGADSETALAGFAAHPDVVVLDVGFSAEGGGFALCRRLRGAGNSMPVVMLMERTADVDVAMARDSGADRCLAKPFRVAELLRCIPALVHR